MKTSLYVLFAFGLTLPSTAAEIPASNFFRPENSTVTITAGLNDVILFDELENSKYLFEGRDLIFTADTASRRAASG